MVGLLYYSQARSKVLPIGKMLPLAKNLIGDEDYYVQKGVGWTLREIGNLNQKQMLLFVKKHLNSLSAIAFSTAMEKIDSKTKLQFKQERKKFF